MKSKLTTMFWAGALALCAVVPNAVAKTNMNGANARRPNAVSAKQASRVASKKSSTQKSAWVPDHVLFKGLADK